MLHSTEITTRESHEAIHEQTCPKVGQWRQECSSCGAIYECDEPTRYCSACGHGLTILSVPSWSTAYAPTRLHVAIALAYAAETLAHR